ncbi:MAG: adenylate/guanylate cyclase domain-containing protein [Pseudomonadota bacterium]
MALAISLPKSLFRHLGTMETDDARMPARVTSLVVAEEERSERMIGWVQLVVIALFAGLYAFTPRPSDAMDAMFEPVPMVLSAYAAFTVARIIAAYRGYLPGWLLVTSMIADVALLYAVIWTFHIAYAQPPAFYLKAPTFAYIFVFIAIRALRFDPRFVISQGLFAAVGWIFMVLYVVEESGTDVITRSFTEYLTQNLVLIGAELDKVFTILLCTAVLSMALYRARLTLLTAVREGAARRDMRRYFGAGVADAITSSEDEGAPGQATERDAAIVMLDLRGFSRFAGNHPAEDVVATLTRYHSLVVPIIERHGGVIDKFLGDGVMATFGALKPSGSAAADALNALSDVAAVAPQWDAFLQNAGYEPVHINGAAVAGRVVTATLGNDERLEFTVIGRAANLAAMLEKHNKVMGTVALTDTATYERAREEGFVGRKGADPEPLGASQCAGMTVDLVKVA